METVYFFELQITVYSLCVLISALPKLNLQL